MPIDISATSLDVQWDSPGSTHRYGAALSARAAVLLGKARALVDVPPWVPENDGEALAGLAELLQFAADEIMARLHRECPDLTARECLDAAEIVLALQSLGQDHQQWVMSRRLRAITSVQDLLGRGDTNVATVLQRAAVEACRTLGFDRTMVFRHRDGLLMAEATHFVGRTDWARECHTYALTYPVELQPGQLEAEMVRRRAAALVTDPLEDPNAWEPIVRKIETRGYVAAPVIVRGEVVATLHADSHLSGRQVGPAERDALAAFATGLCYALERVYLVEHLNDQREAMQRVVDSTQHTIDEFLRGGPIPGPGEARRPSDTSTPVSTALTRDLSARELEILGLMATGATNQEIAARLVLGLATVKSHVKSILRKTGASNRTVAIAGYLNERHQAGR